MSKRPLNAIVEEQCPTCLVARIRQPYGRGTRVVRQHSIVKLPGVPKKVCYGCEQLSVTENEHAGSDPAV